MDEGRSTFRIVIGIYTEAWRLRRASYDLNRNGVLRPQMCAIGSAETLDLPDDRDPILACDPAAREIGTLSPRLIGRRQFHVSSETLFDRLWRQSSGNDLPTAPWMTPEQTQAMWTGLFGGELLLIVNTATPEEQLRCSRIQLMHRPSRVQTHNFAM